MILAVVWVGVAMHAGLSMRRYGRRWWVWFWVSTVLTVIPAAVCSYVEYFRELRRQQRLAQAGAPGQEPAAGDEAAPDGGAGRCPHCGAVLAEQSGRAGPPAAPDRQMPADQKTCPFCGMALEDEHLA